MCHVSRLAEKRDSMLKVHIFCRLEICLGLRVQTCDADDDAENDDWNDDNDDADDHDDDGDDDSDDDNDDHAARVDDCGDEDDDGGYHDMRPRAMRPR